MPRESLSMSQPRGVVEYSNDKFSEMLNRSLQQDKLASSQLENTRSPATNKENDHTQAGHSKEERSDGVLDGVSRDDTLNISHEHHGASSGAGGFGRHPRTIPYEHTSESSAAGVFGRMSNGFGTSSDRSVANRFGGFGGSSVDNTTSAASNGLGDGISNGNGFGDSYVRGSMGHSAQHGPGSEASASAHGDSMSEANGKGDEKWTWKYQNYTFTADREPKGLEIPENFTVHKVFDRDQFVEVRFLTPYDMSNLGQCEGEGGQAVARIVVQHGYLKIDSSTSVETKNLNARLEIRMRANAHSKFRCDPQACDRLKTVFKRGLQSEGWDLTRFDFDDECLAMEWKPPAP